MGGSNYGWTYGQTGDFVGWEGMTVQNFPQAKANLKTLQTNKYNNFLLKFMDIDPAVRQRKFTLSCEIPGAGFSINENVVASDKRKAERMLKIRENDIVAHCITGREYLVKSIRENKCGQRVVELIGHKCNIVREIRTDENGEEYILDEVKLTGGVVEEVRIVPAGNKFTLEVLRATREKFDKVAELVAQRLTVDENGEFILRELTTEEFEEIEKALYKEGSRKVIATLEGD